MLSLLKKKSEAATGQLPAWHPNFRNFERLPDTKVVRTAFFINGAAVAVALILLTYFGVHELQLHTLNTQIAEWDAQINRDKRGSDLAVSQFKKFQAEEARLREVAKFLASRPVVSDLILRLGQTLPKNVAIDTFDLRDRMLVLRCTVRGSSDQATGYATAYVDQVRDDPEIGPQFESVNLTNLNRVAATGRLAIEIAIKFKAPPGTKEAKK